MPYQNIREEELKIRVGEDYFSNFDKAKKIGNVDFCVAIKNLNQTQALIEETESQSFLWAEAKTGKSNIYHSLVQLIITIGKARTFDKELPPDFLGSFDAYQIAFIPYNQIQDIFLKNDFNWNVTPSNYETKEFKQVYQTVETILDSQTLLFNFDTDQSELKEFIKNNFVQGLKETNQIQVNKNNFISIYNKWLQKVKPSIGMLNWNLANKDGIIDGYFYIADLLSDKNSSLKVNLFVLLQDNKYKYNKTINKYGTSNLDEVGFNDNQKAHTQFWNRYKRPPKKDYWDYILNRQDLLVPQNIREIKGSYFTPQIWVEKSQEYLTDVLGENWQDEYYIWDCAAGTGNLLVGLTNKYNIYASTLDQADVDVMKDNVQNGANLLQDHVFQFDFLNDSFDDPKVPKSLQDILKDPEKRKKLVIYINPPYAEADNRKGEGRSGVADSAIHKKYSEKMGYTKRELSIQFFTRIYFEIDGCVIGEFSKLKTLQAPKFIEFRNFFKAKLERCFIVPADTFDNVKGQFPIGFKIWNTSKQDVFKDVSVDIYNEKGEFIGQKEVWAYDNVKYINDWTLKFTKLNSLLDSIATIIGVGNDFQHKNTVVIEKPLKTWNHQYQWQITKFNLIQSSIYLTVRHVFEATWLNDRDQFLYPNDGWQTDTEFQNDCLTFALFHSQNRISSSQGTNHWIPFTEQEVNARERFESHFMTDFIGGKLGTDVPLSRGETEGFGVVDELFDTLNFTPTSPLHFSIEATAVFDAGKELWRYYHTKHGDTVVASTVNKYNPNASLYDIREYFQGRNETGKMNNKSSDEEYSKLITNLRESLKFLALKIQPKVYEYGFLKK